MLERRAPIGIGEVVIGAIIGADLTAIDHGAVAITAPSGTVAAAVSIVGNALW